MKIKIKESYIRKRIRRMLLQEAQIGTDTGITYDDSSTYYSSRSGKTISDEELAKLSSNSSCTKSESERQKMLNPKVKKGADHNGVIAKYGKLFQDACKDIPLFASVKLAQFILETGWGKHTIGDANNLFGIKAKGKTNEFWDGSSVDSSTKEEYSPGVKTTHRLKFRKYKTPEDSIKDHSNLLMTASHYARVREAETPEEQAYALKASGYATGGCYAEALIQIIRMYDLKRFD